MVPVFRYLFAGTYPVGTYSRYEYPAGTVPQVRYPGTRYTAAVSAAQPSERETFYQTPNKATRVDRDSCNFRSGPRPEEPTAP